MGSFVRLKLTNILMLPVQFRSSLPCDYFEAKHTRLLKCQSNRQMFNFRGTEMWMTVVMQEESSLLSFWPFTILYQYEHKATCLLM